MSEPLNLMEQWAARSGWQPPAQGSALDAAALGERANYVRAAIDAETTSVRQAPQGTRNSTLNVAAVKLGRLVPHLVDEDTVRSALQAAGQAAGLGVRETARTITSGLRAGRATPRDPGPVRGSSAGGPRDLTEQVAPRLVVLEQQPQQPDVSQYLVNGGAWLSALPENPPAVWGKADQVLWAQGEALMIAGGPGLGKTTLAGQLVRGRLGLQPQVLDLPVLEGGRLLYLAMDRPQQIGRRLRQQFSPGELAGLDASGRLVLGIGPPPQDVAKNPDLLPHLCAQAGAETLVVDSLKDAAVGLTDDEVGAGYNRARQLCITAGVQVLELHHLVKRGADGKAPTSLADVYGSAWLTAGAGSVLLLSGDAGDPIVKASHLKQPQEPWGPAELAHDHARGVTTIHQRVDLLTLLAVTQVQTASSAARALFATDRPTTAEKERARRRLEGLVSTGKAQKRQTSSGEWQYQPLMARDLGDVL